MNILCACVCCAALGTLNVVCVEQSLNLQGRSSDLVGVHQSISDLVVVHQSISDLVGVHQSRQ
jgi:hypothetical protein